MERPIATNAGTSNIRMPLPRGISDYAIRVSRMAFGSVFL